MDGGAKGSINGNPHRCNQRTDKDQDGTIDPSPEKLEDHISGYGVHANHYNKEAPALVSQHVYKPREEQQ
jgi:hypothetical protein